MTTQRSTRKSWMWGLVGLGVGLLAACPAPKSSYTFEDCPLERGVCNRDITLACAVNRLDERHSSCAVDADCVAAPVVENECVPVTQCRSRLINVNEVEAYTQEVRNEVIKYCEKLDCYWFTSDTCVPPSGSRIACVDSKCEYAD